MSPCRATKCCRATNYSHVGDNFCTTTNCRQCGGAIRLNRYTHCSFKPTKRHFPVQLLDVIVNLFTASNLCTADRSIRTVDWTILLKCLKPRTPNLASVFPWTVPTWPTGCTTDPVSEPLAIELFLSQRKKRETLSRRKWRHHHNLRHYHPLNLNWKLTYFHSPSQICKVTEVLLHYTLKI